MNQQDTSENTISHPKPEKMLERLNQVDTTIFSLEQVTDEVKGKYAWVFILTMPIVAILLMVFTLLGTFITGHFIASFILTAILLFILGKIVDQFEQKFRYQARIEVMRRIYETEEDYGLIPHFKDFLPPKYRHLCQSLKKHNYQYINQYIAALTLLQEKLDPEKFTRNWYIRYPELAPKETTEKTIKDTGLDYNEK